MISVSQLIADRPTPHCLQRDTDALSAARFFRDNDIGGAPVLDGDELVGFCSERDIVYSVVCKGLDPAATSVNDLMSKKVITRGPTDSIEDCARAMQDAHVRHLPIVEGDRVVACISLRDVLSFELRACEVNLEHLTDYVRGEGSGPKS